MELMVLFTQQVQVMENQQTFTPTSIANETTGLHLGSNRNGYITMVVENIHDSSGTLSRW